MFRTKRRVVVLVAAVVLTGAALTVVLLDGWATSGGRSVTDVGGDPNAVLYAPGHRDDRPAAPTAWPTG